MSPRSKKNLMTAMQCDAFDAAKYSRLAAQARKDSDWELAEVFQETSDDDRTEHFAKEAELGGLVASSPDNLRNAVEAETREITMFAEFGRQAKEDGDLGIASVFQRICDDKIQRRAQFEAVLADMSIHSEPQATTA